VGSTYAEPHGHVVSTPALQRVCRSAERNYGPVGSSSPKKPTHRATMGSVILARRTSRCRDVESSSGAGLLASGNSHDKTFPAGLVAGYVSVLL